jgi:hypothetical protein
MYVYRQPTREPSQSCYWGRCPSLVLHCACCCPKHCTERYLSPCRTARRSAKERGYGSSRGARNQTRNVLIIRPLWTWCHDQNCSHNDRRDHEIRGKMKKKKDIVCAVDNAAILMGTAVLRHMIMQLAVKVLPCAYNFLWKLYENNEFQHILVAYVRSCQNTLDRITLFCTLLTQNAVMNCAANGSELAKEGKTTAVSRWKHHTCKTVLYRICTAVVCTYTICTLIRHDTN